MALSFFLTKPKLKALSNPSLFHLFSSSSSFPTPPDDQDNPETPTNPERPFAAYFRDVKASLRQKQQTPSNQNHQDMRNFSPLRRPTPQSSNANRQSPPTKLASLEEIKRNLSEFRLRSSVPPPIGPPNSGPHQQHQHVSFQELYQKKLQEGGGAGGTNATNESVRKSDGGSVGKPFHGQLSFDTIRQSLRRMRENAPANNSSTNESGRDRNQMSFSPFNLKPGSEKTSVIGGTEGLPLAVFGKEIKGREESGEGETSTQFLKIYNYDELGDKLRNLRPEEAKDGMTKGWFSLGELNERLTKLRKLEEKEASSKLGIYKDLRQSLTKLDDDAKAKKNSMHRLNLLGQLSTPDFMLEPPKEHLVEKYFHPDNMSSSEKLKIQLAKVRDEFKKSESDCGSACVQVAQLTTKIKHLSSVLHKKDKHSRKGLLGMVQKRKKLLKYLRRTDWDSYCVVLSKLGLRDNPDYKHRQ